MCRVFVKKENNIMLTTEQQILMMVVLAGTGVFRKSVSNASFTLFKEFIPQLGFKPIPECATLDSRVSDQGRICDFIY